LRVTTREKRLAVFHLLFDVVLNAAGAFSNSKPICLSAYLLICLSVYLLLSFQKASAAFKNVTGKSVARQRLYRWLKPAAGNRGAMTFCGYNRGT